MAAKHIRVGNVQYIRADAVEQPEVQEVIKSVLSAAGITVEQICALADNLKLLCTNGEEKETD